MVHVNRVLKEFVLFFSIIETYVYKAVNNKNQKFAMVNT